MKPEQWQQVINQAKAEAVALIDEHGDRLREAYELGQRKVETVITLTITGEGAYTASILPALSFNVKWAEKGTVKDVIYSQASLPGMPDPTKTGWRTASRA